MAARSGELRVTFTLSEKDLRYFRRRLSEAKASGRPESEIVASSRDALRHTEGLELPSFVTERVAQMAEVLGMLADDEFALGGADRKRVVDTLAYFAEPQDLVPDAIPGLGYLDDAIMIELAARELQHELEAWRDFRHYREKEAGRRGAGVTWPEYAKARRRELHQRMRRRRRARGRLL